MFADSPISNKRDIPEGKQLDSNLLDNWDDSEGYYRFIPNEVLFGRYHVSSYLGKGMFASVLRAQDKLANSLVAIKIVRNNESMYKAGLKELNILKQLNNADLANESHIIQLKDSFDHKNHLCLVFENMECNLRDILKRFGRDIGLNIAAVKSYFKQLLQGLVLLKGCEIIHADLKPDNILIDSSHKYIKISDLGSSMGVSDVVTGSYLASRFYRAPEVIIGLKPGFPADMWSVGCTIFELYTGNILFPGSSNNEMLRLMMEMQGGLSRKMLKKGEFTHQHYNKNFDFLSTDKIDKVTEKAVTKVIKDVGPFQEKSLESRLRIPDLSKGSYSHVIENGFLDLLKRVFILNPDKRITPEEALCHHFFH